MWLDFNLSSCLLFSACSIPSLFLTFLFYSPFKKYWLCTLGIVSYLHSGLINYSSSIFLVVVPGFPICTFSVVPFYHQITIQYFMSNVRTFSQYSFIRPPSSLCTIYFSSRYNFHYYISYTIP